MSLPGHLCSPGQTTCVVPICILGERPFSHCCSVISSISPQTLHLLSCVQSFFNNLRLSIHGKFLITGNEVLRKLCQIPIRWRQEEKVKTSVQMCMQNTDIKWGLLFLNRRDFLKALTSLSSEQWDVQMNKTRCDLQKTWFEHGFRCLQGTRHNLLISVSSLELWRKLLMHKLPNKDWGREKETVGTVNGRARWAIMQDRRLSFFPWLETLSSAGSLLRNPVGAASVPSNHSCAHREQPTSSPWLGVCVSTWNSSVTPHYPQVKSRLLASSPAWPRAPSPVTVHPRPPAEHCTVATQEFLPVVKHAVLFYASCLCTCCFFFLEFLSSPFSQWFQTFKRPRWNVASSVSLSLP